jgi:hypothetical protein
MSRTTKPKAKPVSSADRTKLFEANKKAKGLARRWVWCKPEHADYLRDLADMLAEDPALLEKVKKLIT